MDSDSEDKVPVPVPPLVVPESFKSLRRSVFKVAPQSIPFGFVTIVTGFFGQFVCETNGDHLRGLFTSYRGLERHELREGRIIHLEFKDGTSLKIPMTKNNYSFACHFLDISFVALTDEQVEYVVSKYGVIFLEFDRQYKVTPDDFVLFVQFQETKGYAVTQTRVGEMWGIGFKHFTTDTPTDKWGSFGAPFVDEVTCKVFAIQKVKTFRQYEIHDIAHYVKFILEAIEKEIFAHQYQHSPSFLTPLPAHLIQELKDNTHLDVKNQVIFEGSGYFSYCWFYRTHHFWYWTNTGNVLVKSNWMRISHMDDTIAVGGRTGGQHPQQANLAAIEYLREHGQKYCVWQRELPPASD